MADDSLQFTTDDSDFTAKMNRKTTFVGTGTQINSIVNPYPGQWAFCTSTGSGFIINRIYQRNTANTSWILIRELDGGIEVSAEQNAAGVADLDDTVLNNQRMYWAWTMPSTEDFYIITGLEWICSVIGGGGNVVAGVDICVPNTGASMTAAITREKVVAVATQRSSDIASDFIPAGTACASWLSASSTPKFRSRIGGGSFEKSIGYTVAPTLEDNSTWNASTGEDGTQHIYVKTYFKGFTKSPRIY